MKTETKAPHTAQRACVCQHGAEQKTPSASYPPPAPDKDCTRPLVSSSSALVSWTVVVEHLGVMLTGTWAQRMWYQVRSEKSVIG